MTGWAFCVLTRMIFDKYNKITANGLFNVFKFDSMAYKTLFKEKRFQKCL